MSSKSRLSTFPYWHEVVLVGLLGGLVALVAVVDPAFLSVATQVELSTHLWEMALIAIPMTLVIITAGIDLSVGSIMALCAVVLGLTFEAGISPWIGATLAMITGIGAGALNGIFVARVKVHPLIVTLATLAAYAGIAEGISLGRPISGFPASFIALSQASLFGLPVAGALFIGFALVGAVVLARTPLGRSLYAIGHNETAARFSGISTDRIKLLLYTFSGTAAGLAAVIYVARRNTAKADIGQDMGLDVITAVVLGGTSIFGGRGHIFGTVLGLVLIHLTREFVSWHWNRNELNLVVIGLLLIFAVLFNRMLSQKSRS
jgi:rhamnose transport system permease protein